MTRSSRGYLLSCTILPCCPEFGNALVSIKERILIIPLYLKPHLIFIAIYFMSR